jgi:hypothetical protein
MKDKNCVDPKMAVYCQAVCDLEDKFHRLELHHVLRDYKRLPTYSQRSHLVEVRCLTKSLRVINMPPMFE